jgi:flagellar basal-body rod protein FlgB
MSSEIDRLFGLHQASLSARANRSQVIASNIANADTPGYQARDLDFKASLSAALGSPSARPATLLRTSARHLSGPHAGAELGGAALVYRSVAQASIDNNTVDVNVERAQFADNAMRMEASLVFINAKIKSLLAAVQS